MGRFDFITHLFRRVLAISGDTRARTTDESHKPFKPRQKLILRVAGGLAVFLVVWIVVLMILTRSDSSNRRSAGQQSDKPPAPFADLLETNLPMEELFLADEPDFLPPVLLERERRDAWTVEDVRPYWTDPLEEGAAVYQDMMSGVVDRIMERVP
jgi:hypothetical protein